MKHGLFAIASVGIVATAVGVETANAQYAPAPPAYTPPPAYGSGLWLRPRTIRGRRDRQSCHRKMVQDRSERLPILLDAIASTSLPARRINRRAGAPDN
jgi:hypothetical protein